MRICVVGCGAVGSIFAGHLAQLDDVEVWAYDLDRLHVAAINEDGLRLSGAGELIGRVHATSDAAEIPSCDYGIVATKSAQTADAIAATWHAFPDGAVCSVQNGVGNEEILAERVGNVIRGTTFVAGHVVGPGRVVWDARGDTWIGPFEPSGTAMGVVERLAEALTRAGMNAVALEDARGAQWTKLIFNAAINPVGALTGLAHGRIWELEWTKQLVQGLLDEGKAVARALGITLDSDPEELVIHGAKVAYEHRPSMLQDVLARRQTEIDFLSGGIVAAGRQAGVPTPLSEALWALVKGVERSWTQPAEEA